MGLSNLDTAIMFSSTFDNRGPALPLIQPTMAQSTSYDSNSQYTEDMSPSPGESPPPQNYQLKTMCLAKKCVQMPTKEEHGFLLFCGLGARRWQCAIDCNSLTFKQAILNIYPRLRSVIGYNLWTLTKDKKTFEKIPEKVNTPMRMRSYLGSHFTGCLIIVPVSDIVLMEEKREHLRQIDIKQVQDCTGLSTMSLVAPSVIMESDMRKRSLCLICGKIEKTPGTGSFHRIMEESMACPDGIQVIAKKLTDILGFNFEQSKRKFIASTEICKKCLRSVTDVVKMEEQLKRHKEDLVSNFFSTTSKFNKNLGSQIEETKSEPLPQVSNNHNMATDHLHSQANNFQERKGFNTAVNQNGYTHPFLVQSLPQSLAFLNQPKGIQYGSCIGQYHRPYPPMSAKPKSDMGSTSFGGSSPERIENCNYRTGSDYAASEVGSSCFVSIPSPPPPKQQEYVPVNQDPDTDSQAGSISPRPFDAQSCASTFSFRSTNSSIRSKAEIKSYEESSKPLPASAESSEQVSEQAECRKLDQAERYPEPNKVYSRGQGIYDSNEGSPQSPESTGTPSSESFESITPNATSPTPEDDLAAEEERAERRKPAKKRKRAQESDLHSSYSEKARKIEPSNESLDRQNQHDASTSDQN